MFSFISCRTFKPTNFAALKNTVQYNNKCWGWNDICKTDNPQASKQDKAKKIANPWQYSNLITKGAFNSTETSSLIFRQLPVANGTAFSKISKKSTTSQGIPKFSKKFSQTGCKESHYYSLPFRQAEANI